MPRPTYWPIYDNLEQLARNCDCLVVTCALTPATRNLINAPVLAALGTDGFLVNIARGAIVDEQALIAALTNKKIAGAALDVFADEPNVPDALMRMDNVILLPHIGTATREVRDGRMEKLLHDVQAYLAGRPLRYATTGWIHKYLILFTFLNHVHGEPAPNTTTPSFRRSPESRL